MSQVVAASSERESRWTTIAETGLILLVFFLYAGWPPPSVNEAHYLAKAKHYWQPDWCAGDRFLTSADAHLVFFWTFGWLTRLAPLAAVAWIGRAITWGLLAWSWQRLSWAIVPRRFVSLWTAGGLLLFNGRFHLAGEWVVGGVEAKGISYAFVFFALGALVRQRWNAAWILLGLATMFHPLVGGWSLVAAGCAWLSCGKLRPPLSQMRFGLAAALILALPGLIPALLLNRGVSPDVALQADLIYVYRRLSHHLVVHRFPHAFMARYALLLGVWLTVCFVTPCRACRGELGQRPLRGFVAGSLLIAAMGILIDQALLQRLDLAAPLLKYYWYRLADVMLPAGAALALARWMTDLEARRPAVGQAAFILGGLLVVAGVGQINYEQRQDLRPLADIQSLPSWPNRPQETRQVYDQWREACRWIAVHTPRDACFITPRMQETFKWYAQRSEVCCWKDVPQDAGELVAWWQRLRDLYPRRLMAGGLAAHGEPRLRELANQYGAQYIVSDRWLSQRPLNLVRVYPPPGSPEATSPAPFEVYWVGPRSR